MRPPASLPQGSFFFALTDTQQCDDLCAATVAMETSEMDDAEKSRFVFGIPRSKGNELAEVIGCIPDTWCIVDATLKASKGLRDVVPGTVAEIRGRESRLRHADAAASEISFEQVLAGDGRTETIMVASDSGRFFASSRALIMFLIRRDCYHGRARFLRDRGQTTTSPSAAVEMSFEYNRGPHALIVSLNQTPGDLKTRIQKATFDDIKPIVARCRALGFPETQG